MSITPNVQQVLNDFKSGGISADSREALRKALEGVAPVQWPSNASDISGPATALVDDLNLKEVDRETFAFWKDTPFDKQAITAGATRLGRWLAVALGTTGFASALGAVITAAQHPHGYGAWVLVAAATVLIVGTSHAVAAVASADLDARGTATAAQYLARAQAAGAYMLTVRPQAAKTGRDEESAAGVRNRESMTAALLLDGRDVQERVAAEVGRLGRSL